MLLWRLHVSIKIRKFGNLNSINTIQIGAQCPEDDMERNVGESKLFKGVQVICSITALKLKVPIIHCTFSLHCTYNTLYILPIHYTLSSN